MKRGIEKNFFFNNFSSVFSLRCVLGHAFCSTSAQQCLCNLASPLMKFSGFVTVQCVFVGKTK